MSVKVHEHALGAAESAAEFSVLPEIHGKDYIFEYKLDMNHSPDIEGRNRAETRTYFRDGDYSRGVLVGLLEKYVVRPEGRPLELLEFASGYGCVSRHLRKHSDIHLTACDIHPEAIAFLRETIGVDAVLSASEPEELRIDRKFDAIFALSFFSHMPDVTFGRWLNRLASLLRSGGCFIFTTHGFKGYTMLERPDDSRADWTVSGKGCWFQYYSEQKDLPVADYGVTLVTPKYVVDQINELKDVQLVRFEQAFWWGTQDLYILRKEDTEFRSNGRKAVASGEETEIQRLREELDLLRNSTSWRLTSPLRKAARKIRGV